MSGCKRETRRFTSGAMPAAVVWMGLIGAAVGLMIAGCAPTTPTPETLVANAGADATVAQGQVTLLSGSATGGTAPYAYAWVQTSGSAQSLTDNGNGTASVAALVAGTATFQLTVTDAAGTTATDTVVLTVTAAASDLTVDAGADQTADGGDAVALTALATGGTAPISFFWQVTASGSAGSVALTNADSQTATATFSNDAAGTFTFQVTATDADSGNATDTVDVVVTATPVELAFTLNIDDLAGTAGDDTFTASTELVAGVPTGTLQDNDSADGGDGNDTLSVLFVDDAANDAIDNVTLTDIEALTFTVLDVAKVVDATAFTGVTSVAVQNSTAALTLNTLPAIPTLAVTNGDQNVTLGFAADAIAETDDATTLTLSNVTGGTIALPGIETVSVVSSGAENTLTALNAAAAETVNVSGDQDLDFGGNLAATVATLDASTATGGVTASLLNTDPTVTGGAGDDAITFAGGAGDVTVDGGAGDDTFVVGGTYTTDDAIEGGDGDDTLSVTSAIAVAVAADQTNVTNVEGLTISNAIGGDIDTSYFGSIDTVTAAAGWGGAHTLTLASGTDVVTQADTGAANVTFVVAGDGITDTMSLTLEDADFGAAVLLTGVETLSLVSADAANTITGALTMTPSDPAGPTIGATVLNISGDQDMTITGDTTAETVDASTLEGDLTLTAAASADITGGLGDDTLTGSAASDAVDGGAGDDTIDGAAGDDDLAGGEGDDEITGGAGADVIAGGAGEDTLQGDAGADDITCGDDADTIVYAATTDGGAAIANADTINDFDGTEDTITIEAGGAIDTALGTPASLTDGTDYAEVTVAAAGDPITAAEIEAAAAATTIADGADYILFVRDSTNGVTYLVYDTDHTGAAGVTFLADLGDVALADVSVDTILFP